jgi:hypothetical protein
MEQDAVGLSSIFSKPWTTKRPTPAHKEPHYLKKGAGVLNDRNLRGGQYTARKKRGLSPSILPPGLALLAKEELNEGLKGLQT